MRLKYPHIAIGALASSAPILQFENIVPPETFYDLVSNDFKVSTLSFHGCFLDSSLTLLLEQFFFLTKKTVCLEQLLFVRKKKLPKICHLPNNILELLLRQKTRRVGFVSKLLLLVHKKPFVSVYPTALAECYWYLAAPTRSKKSLGCFLFIFHCCIILWSRCFTCSRGKA